MSESQPPQNEPFLIDDGSGIEPYEPAPFMDWASIDGQAPLAEQADPTLRQRAGELVGSTVDFARAAYHGLAARVALIREQRAATVMERMDHKDALYGDIAVGHYRQDQASAFVEETDRLKGVVADAKELGKKAHSDDLKSLAADRANRGEIELAEHRGTESDLGDDGLPTPHITTHRGVRPTPPELMEKAKPRSVIEKIMDRRMMRKHEKKMVANIDARVARRVMGHETTPQESSFIRRTQRDVGKYERGLEGSVRRVGTPLRRGAYHVGADGRIDTFDPTLVQRWREGRRQRAIGRIKTNHRRREQHLAAIDRIAPDVPEEELEDLL